MARGGERVGSYDDDDGFRGVPGMGGKILYGIVVNLCVFDAGIESVTIASLTIETLGIQLSMTDRQSFNLTRNANEFN
jgi:hypothetical protein